MRSRPRCCVLLTTDLLFQDGRFEPTSPPRHFLPLLDVVAVDHTAVLVAEAPVPEVVRFLGGAWTEVTVEAPEPVTRAVWSKVDEQDHEYTFECAALAHAVHSGELDCSLEASLAASVRASRGERTTDLWCRYGWSLEIERVARTVEVALLGSSFRVDPDLVAHVLVWTDAPPHA